MKSSLSACPVPKEQQPLNEYQDLSESWFFRWATLDWVAYLKPLGVLWLLSGLVVGPMAAISFPMQKYPLEFALSTAGGSCLLPLLALARLTLGWNYVRDRLRGETVFYEESGWYDGQIWEKPAEVLQRDRLIVTYQIQPLLQRLYKTFAAFTLCFVLGSILWNLL